MESASNRNVTFLLTNQELVAISTINVIFSLLGTLGNVMVCLAFLSHTNLRTIMNIFIFSLAISDLVICVFAQPMFVVSIVKQYQQSRIENTFEDIRKRLTWISLLASAGNLSGVTLDRYIAIQSPLRYCLRMSTKRVFVAVCLIWTVAIVMGLLTGPYPKTKFVGEIYVLVLLVMFICPLYCHVLCIARKHARVIQSVMSHMVKFEGTDTILNRRRSSIVRKADRNSLKTVGIISIIFMIGWLPLLILPLFLKISAINNRVLLRIFQWVNTLALCSAAANPIVYSWRDRRFRTFLKLATSRWNAKRVLSQSSRVTSERNNSLRTSISMVSTIPAS